MTECIATLIAVHGRVRLLADTDSVEYDGNKEIHIGSGWQRLQIQRSRLRTCVRSLDDSAFSGFEGLLKRGRCVRPELVRCLVPLVQQRDAHADPSCPLVRIIRK